MREYDKNLLLALDNEVILSYNVYVQRKRELLTFLRSYKMNDEDAVFEDTIKTIIKIKEDIKAAQQLDDEIKAIIISMMEDLKSIRSTQEQR